MRKRPTPNAREDGTVLLSTLLVLSLMSAVTLALLASLTLSIKSTARANDLAQADLYAQGAEDFARAQLRRAGVIDTQAMIAISRAEPIILPFDNGLIRLQITDGTHCLRLSGLADKNGTGHEPSRRQLAALIAALGYDAGRAGSIAAAAVDWVDRDQQALPGGAEDGTYLLRNPAHRTANVPFQSVSELRALQGMDEALFRALRPFVCLGEAGRTSRFNINTASAGDVPVLAALLGGEAAAIAAAEALILARPDRGYTAESLKSAPSLEGLDLPEADFGAIIFNPDRIRIETVIEFGSAQRVRMFAFALNEEGVDSGAPRLTYEDWGWDSLHPQSRFLGQRYAGQTRQSEEDRP